MSAIWGCIEYKNNRCIESMASEFKRKCRLERIKEVPFNNALIGSGIQVINDEDEYESMPYIIDDEKTIITADCIIDNRKELIKELMPLLEMETDINSIPSGKLICLAYKKWSYDFVEHLEGMFAIAIYNADKQELFLCTDRVSSRSLYYFKNDNRCIFSTLISPIKKIVSDLKVNYMYLNDFALLPGLMPNISYTETPWEEVYIIEPGCSMLISKGGITKKRYYKPEKKYISDDLHELKEEFLKVYKKAVIRATRTNMNVGIALSGGLDSSSIAAFAEPEMAKHGKKLISYTYVPYYNVARYFDKRMVINEAKYVEEISRMYPSIETNYVNNDGKSFWGDLDELLDIMEIPFKAFVNLPILLDIYKKAADKGCKVFLTGQTGNASVSYGNIDDTIYDKVRKGHYISAFCYYNNFCKKAGISRKRFFPKEIKKILSQSFIGNDQRELSTKNINPFVNANLLNEYKFSSRNKSGLILAETQRILRSEEFLNKLYFLPALSYIGAMETKMGLNTGIVIRDATRDTNVLDYCASFPFDCFCHNSTPRYLIRGFMEEFLPSKILYPIIKSGVQSADWIYRLRKEKKEVFKGINMLSIDRRIEHFLDLKKVTEFRDKELPFTHSNEREYLNLFIVYILYVFIKNEKMFQN